MFEYEIEGATEACVIDGKEYMGWKVIKDGVFMGVIFGPSSLPLALASIEAISKNKNFYDGWTDRAQKYIKRE